MNPPSPPQGPSPRLVLLGLSALVLLAYGATLGFGFVYDDTWTIVENAVIRDPGNLLQLWSPVLAQEGVPDAARPLMLASLMLDYALWGSNPAGYHLSNVLWHLGVVLLLYGVILRFLGRGWLAPLAAGLFAVHPLGAEVVAAVNYREDLLATAFLLLGVLALGVPDDPTPDVGGGRRFVRRVLAFAAFAASALAKESGYLGPLVLLALEAALAEPLWMRLRRRRWDHAVVWAAVLVVFAWRAAVLANPLRVSLTAELPAEHRVTTALAQAGLAFWQSVAAFVWPVKLAPEYPHPPEAPWALALGWLGMVGLFAAVGLGLVLRRRCPPIALGLWLGVIGYLPYLGFVPLTNLRADRYFYFPALGFALCATAAAGGGLRRLIGRQAPDPAAPQSTGGQPRGDWLVPAALATAVLLLLVGRTVRQTRVWRSDATVFAAATARDPGSQRAWIGLAYARLEQGRSLEALTAARRALALAPSARAHEALAVVLARQGAHAEARTALEAALAATPVGERFYRGQLRNNLGLIELLAGRAEVALAHLEEAKRLAPRLEVAGLNAARAYEALGKSDTARRELRALLAWSPRFVPALKYLGTLAEAAGDRREARRAYENARALAPEDPEVARALLRLQTGGKRSPPPGR